MTNQAQAKRNAALLILTLLAFILALINIMQGNIFFYISAISFSIVLLMRVFSPYR